MKKFASVLGLCAITMSTASAFGQTIDQKMVEADKALTQQISIPCGHYAIGELLEMLTHQSSVVLESADPNDGGSGLEVTVCLRSQPLNETMNALYALLSFKQHEWKWIRTGKPGSYTYKLSRPLEAQNLPTALQAWSQDALEKEAKKFIDALQLSPEELKEAGKTDSWLKALADSPRAQDGIHEFATMLPPDMQLAVLRGSASPKFQVSQLDERGKQWVHNIWKNSQPDGVATPSPEPTWIQFRTDPASAPTICMYIDIENQGGYGYFGGRLLDNAFREYFANLWILPGDNAHVDLEQQVVKRLDGIVIKNQNRVMEERLGQLSTAMPVSFMARLPQEQRYDPHQIAGVPLEKFLNAFRGMGYELQSKWRAGTLLLTDDTLYQEDLAHSNPAPWIVMKHVRAMREHSQGVFVWADLVALSHDYDAKMLTRLGKEFPVATALLECNDLFRSFYGDSYRTKKLFSKEGIPVLYVQDLCTGKPFAHLLESSASGKKPVNIRATEEQSLQGGIPYYVIKFESLDETGTVLKKTAFSNQGS